MTFFAVPFPVPDKTGDTWTYAGWCPCCFFRAVDPGRSVCAACAPLRWDQELPVLDFTPKETP